MPVLCCNCKDRSGQNSASPALQQTEVRFLSGNSRKGFAPLVATARQALDVLPALG